jgi:hypothetical protein
MNRPAAIRQLFSEEHVSSSSIRRYLQCPRAYRFAYVERIPPETRASALCYGIAIHDAVEHLLLANKHGAPEPSHEELATVFRDSFQKQLDGETPVVFSDKESADGLIDTAVASLRCYLDQAPRPHKVVEVEMPFNIEIVDRETGEVLPRLVGVVDAVTQREDGTFELWELKSGARRWSEDQLNGDVQLTCYSLAAPQVGLGDAALQVHLLLKTKKPAMEVYTPTRSEADRQEFLDVITGVLRAVRAEAFHPVRSWACRGCSFLGECNSCSQ